MSCSLLAIPSKNYRHEIFRSFRGIGLFCYRQAEIVAFVGSPGCTVKSYKLDRFEMKMLDKDTALLTYWEEQDTVCNKQVPSPCWVSSLYMKRGDKWLNVFYQQTQIQK